MTVPRELSDPTAHEFVAFQRRWLEDSLEAVDLGVKTDREHARAVAACWSDAVRFLDRFGDSRPVSSRSVRPKGAA